MHSWRNSHWLAGFRKITQKGVTDSSLKPHQFVDGFGEPAVEWGSWVWMPWLPWCSVATASTIWISSGFRPWREQSRWCISRTNAFLLAFAWKRVRGRVGYRWREADAHGCVPASAALTVSPSWLTNSTLWASPLPCTSAAMSASPRFNPCSGRPQMRATASSSLLFSGFGVDSSLASGFSDCGILLPEHSLSSGFSNVICKSSFRQMNASQTPGKR